jgi:hypothetical protein
MPSAYIGTSGREAATLVSLFSTHVSKLWENNMTGMTENSSKFGVHAVVGFLQAEEVNQREISC